MQLWLLLSVVAGSLCQLVAHLWQGEEFVVSDSAVVVAGFLVPSFSAGHLWCAAVAEGLGFAEIAVFLSFYFPCWHFVLVWHSFETAAHS